MLDIDGVLATSGTYRKAKWKEGHDPGPLLSPLLAERVNRLCRLAGAELVISSSWRLQHSLGELRNWFDAVDLDAPIIGRTPSSDTGHRGFEIGCWLKDHQVNPNQIVILDDDTDIKPYTHRWIQTSFHGPHAGFQERHLRRALRLFGIKHAA